MSLLAASTETASYQAGQLVGALCLLAVIAVGGAKVIGWAVGRARPGGRHRSRSVPLIAAYAGPVPPTQPGYQPPVAYPPVGYPQTGYSPPVGYPPGGSWAPLPPPVARRGMRTWTKVGIGFIALVFGLGFVANVADGDRKLRTPATAAGLERLDDEQYRPGIQRMKSSVTEPFHDPVAAMYGEPGDHAPMALILAAKADHADVDEAFAGMTQGISEGAGGPMKLTSYPAGKLGGTMRCGVTGETSPTLLTVCVWVDDHTVGLVLVFSQLPEAAPLAIALREAIEE